MSYATPDDLTERFGAEMIRRLTDRSDPPNGWADPVVVARALADTDGVIDGFLRSRYLTPVRDVPAQLRDIAISIAIYKLHRYSPEAKIKDDYDAAMKALRDIQAGTILLTVEGVTPAVTGGTGARITDRERPLTAENLRGYI